MSFPLRYSVDIPPTSLSAASDLVQLTAATNAPIRVHALFLVQTTDFGDAQDELLTVTWVRGNTVTGSGGAAATPVQLINNGTAATFTAQVVNTTPASSGTAVNVLRQGWQVRQPIAVQYSGDSVFGTASTDGFLCLRMSAPADAITVSGSVIVEQLEGPI